VKQKPSLVISHLQLLPHMLHMHMVMPFHVQQQLTMPPSSILQRFCKAPQATSSSHMQYIFMPPAHFSMRIVQRGSIVMPLMPGIAAGIVPPMGIPIGDGIVMPRSIIIIALDISHSLCFTGARRSPQPAADLRVHSESESGIETRRVPPGVPVSTRPFIRTQGEPWANVPEDGKQANIKSAVCNDFPPQRDASTLVRRTGAVLQTYSQ